jgi:DNA-binding GntR family transcriptional regulator
LEQIYAMRIALEPLGVRITVPQLNSEQLGQLQTALDDLAVAVDRRQPSEMREPHRRFHFGLVALAGTRLLRSIADLWDHAERYRRLYLAEGPDHLAMYALAHREHAEILAAATDRDGVACGQLVADHLARTALSVLARSHGRREPSAVNEALDLASTRAKRSPRGE